jgi:hypothetical protein
MGEPMAIPDIRPRPRDKYMALHQMPCGKKWLVMKLVLIIRYVDVRGA